MTGEENIFSNNNNRENKINSNTEDFTNLDKPKESNKDSNEVFLNKINFENTSNMNFNNNYNIEIYFKSAGKIYKSIKLSQIFKYLNNTDVDKIKFANDSKAKSFISLLKKTDSIPGISKLTDIQKIKYIKIILYSHKLSI